MIIQYVSLSISYESCFTEESNWSAFPFLLWFPAVLVYVWLMKVGGNISCGLIAIFNDLDYIKQHGDGYL
jgi:hypothetical protein